MERKFKVILSRSSFFLTVTLSMLFFLPLLLSCGKTSGKGISKISNPTAKEVVGNFENPPIEYSLSFFWGWDGNITENVIARDLDEFKANNVHIVTLEAGYEMNASYLSQGWFEKVDTAVQLVKERDMRLYLVDEGKYPSGFAGGKISSNTPELGMKVLMPTDTIIMLKTDETLSVTLSEDVVSAAAYNKDKNIAETLDIVDGKLNWVAPEGEWEIVLIKHAFRSSPTRSANNPTKGKDTNHSLIDYLDSNATKKFIDYTHEEYKKYVGSEFGKTVLGFRGDEPDFSVRGIPWTTDIFDKFKTQKGYDVRPYVATFFTEQLTNEQLRAKADYWDVWSTLFADNFFKVQADWCDANNLEYLVHLNHEEDMVKLIKSEGDFFKTLRTVQMPGVDAIWHQIWPGEVSPIYPKYASSIAHVNGHLRSFTESFAAYTPRPDIKQAKWIIDQQFVRGINMVEVMFVPASSKGQTGMRGWLADEKFPDIAKYIHRACYMLSQGVPAAKIAVLYPVSSIWLGNNALDKPVQDIMQKLLDTQHDFDVIDEQSLESLILQQNGRFTNKSGQEYTTVIIPPLTTISSKAIDQLTKFENSGGKVISIGNKTVLSVKESFLKAELTDFNWNISETSKMLTPMVMEALDTSDFILSKSNESIKYLHRKWQDADLYFIFNEGEERFDQKITLSSKGKVQIWDAMNGQITEYPGTAIDKNSVEIELSLDPWETKFVIIGNV